MYKYKWLVTFVIIIASVACISFGNNFNTEKIRQIENDITTKAQIRAWFGHPHMTGIDDGDETWIYNYSYSPTIGTTHTKNLYLIFKIDETVKSFSFSTSFPDEITEKL
ncbi:MAG TPA: outer membrane protein assembly factor BamE [Nitrospinota bacterium]|nr:outer membrane protein assembly factor BamE [Nitrospinota bacterium]|tara:strand:+ start:18985 stop:19311 length:327 start_codon:yes stop_codon:yes gene_type:complete